MSADAALEKLAALWKQERVAAIARAKAEREGRPLAERVERGTSARLLSVDEMELSPGGRVRVWLVSAKPEELELFRAGPGDPVRLWRLADPKAEDETDLELRAIVARRKGPSIAVVVDDATKLASAESGWNLDREEPLTTFDRGDRAIARMREAKPGTDLERMREVIFGERAPRFAARKPLEWKDADLNEAQREAAAHALSSQDIALVHGPPGTGKSRTLVEVVRQAVARGERVLVAAASNTAVDVLAARLAGAGADPLRLGHPARVAPEVEACTLDARLDAGGGLEIVRTWLADARKLRGEAFGMRSRGPAGRSEFRRLMAEAANAVRDAQKYRSGVEQAILSRARVVCATAAGADDSLLGEEPFDLVVLDEATQAADPVALAAIARGRRLVLAGDPRQLPPTVIDPDAARAGLGVTIFERLEAARGDALRMLVVQHRMHEAIMAFPSASMYEGKLVAAPEVARHTLADLSVADDPGRPGPWHFIDTSGTSWNEERGAEDPSTRNPGQAARVVEETRRLIARGLSPEAIAVITPYDAQVRLLREALRPETARGLEVGTVDGFQGREKEAVIVDLVRSNDDGFIGFLADTRRMNVAITRAKRFLLVIGDGATLGGNRYYAAFLEAANAHGAWLSAWDA